MPPRQGQLDQISASIGRVEGRFEGLEQYIHEHRHDVKEVSQKIDGLRVALGKDIAAVEARLETKLDSFKAATEARLTALERAREREQGGRGLVKAVLASPVVAWLFAAAVAVWTYLSTHGGVR